MSTHRVPRDLVDLSDSISMSQEEDERSASQLMALFACMCNLVASMKDSSAPNVSKTIVEAASLDLELTTWAENAPDCLHVSRQSSHSSEICYSDSYEVFSSTWSVELWMLHRTARFGVNSLLVSLFSAVMAHTSARSVSSPPKNSSEDGMETDGIQLRLQECSSTLETLRVDLCSMVPFLLDQHQQTSLTLGALPLHKRTPAINLLVFLARMQGTGEKMRGWAESLLIELQAEEGVDKGGIVST